MNNQTAAMILVLLNRNLGKSHNQEIFLGRSEIKKQTPFNPENNRSPHTWQRICLKRMQCLGRIVCQPSCWLAGALHWIRGKYKTFMANGVKNIRVPGDMSPAKRIQLKLPAVVE